MYPSWPNLGSTVGVARAFRDTHRERSSDCLKWRREMLSHFDNRRSHMLCMSAYFRLVLIVELDCNFSSLTLSSAADEYKQEPRLFLFNFQK